VAAHRRPEAVVGKLAGLIRKNKEHFLSRR
jgi:hypothetical protein